ncbi:MAG: phospho-N-acetylmuramoyl-pentapeptide-transferase [Anaerolineae bacterium]|nr:phospho-N-acetylmuramoyl-pentapeptide-transferase [Anaerolineae bacterium]MCB0177153.1 phospho-N-acetylmuramoyl-pentapeptide-transferase [Anaerolineae bacterium]MCB0222261.1 phospho-N-acetylmuramoyl-pentapeptide-transferase [Anaerolineae bacterium]MCB9107250.1 phospho-N-acetylmuramoyl-pentapeptide-transferase [Anaerolineales bacterium]
MAYSLTLGTISFILAVIWGRPLINVLREWKIGKSIRIEGPSTHQVKTGTPTMGGLMILIPVLVVTIVLNVANLMGFTLIGRSVLVPMGVMVAFGTLGAIDDLIGVRVIPTGLVGRHKILWQTIFALITALFLHFALDLTSIAIPGVADKIDIGWFYIPVAMFIIVGTSNAVNLTDGLDGLAGSIAAVAFAAYGVIAFLQGQIWLVAFAFTVVGAVLAFLWYNAHPAELFMGDTGSLAIGATLAVVALMTGQWLLLPVVGFVFMAEAISVILQVGYFKLTGGKRLFKMSPLHHHFELLGWSETHVTQRFWLIGILTAMLGIALALI